MNALRIKHKIAGVLGMLAMLVWHPAMAAGVTGVQVLDGFKELAGYVGSPFLLGGAWVAVKITLIAMSTGLVLGLGLALMRLSRFKALNSAAWGYIWFVRGTPQLLQLVFIFDALPLIGLRFDEITTAVIGFALNEAAFSAELFRAGILSVNRSQSTAAAALGMGPLLTLRRIILPQSMRAVIPGLANDTIGMLKLTSIASVIFVNELTFRSQQVVGQNFKFFTVFGAAAVIYLFLTSGISLVQVWLEGLFDHERERKVQFSWFGLRASARDLKPEAPVVVPASVKEPLANDHAWIGTLLPAGSRTPRHRDEPFVACKNVWK